MHPDQMAALVAVADTGSFDRAASCLGVSTSAVSQRIRALESGLGRVLLRRGAPSTVTETGATVLRYARQQQLLAGEMTTELGLEAEAGDPGGQGEGPVELPVAVNEDSLATWFPAVFTEAARWSDVRLRLVAAHEGRTAELLRDGGVMAAVSAGSGPVAGCRSEPLGEVSYLPVAVPALLEGVGLEGDGDRGAPGGERERARLSRLPVLRFDAVDDLEDLVLEASGLPLGLPGPNVPGAEAYTQALLAGMGWGLLTRSQAARNPGLVAVPGLVPVVRELTWYRWRLRSVLLDRLTDAVHRAFGTSA